MAAAPTSRISRLQWLAPVALAIVAAATFARGIGYGYVFDDMQVICGSDRMRQLSSALEVFVRPSTWIISDWSNSRLITYRPLALATMVLDSVVFGGAWRLHLTNVLLHVACTLLFFRLLLDLQLRRATAFALALLFSVHPVGAEAITWINGRSEPLCLLFGLIALSCCTRAPLAPLRLLLLALALCFSLLGKETGLAFLILGSALLGRRNDRAVWIRGTAALVAGLAGYLFLRSIALRGTEQQLSFSFGVFSIIPPLWSRSLQAAILPHNLGLENLRAWLDTTTPPEWVLFELMAAFFVSATLLGWLRGRTLTSVGLAWWLGMLAAPSITFATGISWPGLCRWVYLALPGLLLASAPFIERYATPARTYAVSGMLAVVLAVEAQHSITLWSDDVTLMQHMAAEYPKDTYAPWIVSQATGRVYTCPRERDAAERSAAVDGVDAN